MCVCVEGIFHVEPTSMQDTKRQNLNVFENCIYEDEKKSPHEISGCTFVQFGCRSMPTYNTSATPQHSKKAQENFYLRILKKETQKQRSRQARVSE